LLSAFLMAMCERIDGQLFNLRPPTSILAYTLFCIKSA